MLSKSNSNKLRRGTMSLVVANTEQTDANRAIFLISSKPRIVPSMPGGRNSSQFLQKSVVLSCLFVDIELISCSVVFQLFCVVHRAPPAENGRTQVMRYASVSTCLLVCRDLRETCHMARAYVYACVLRDSFAV